MGFWRRSRDDEELADAVEQLRVVLSLQLTPVLRKLVTVVERLAGEEPPRIEFKPPEPLSDEEAAALREEWLRKYGGGDAADRG